ncbi:uncharacterized protein [Typha angustifolia]|uniref:uncharacterized protein isoform X2 n=1 Tax=Typha angustifolia TaxID=59011 RepID=UPI003C2D6E21
MARGRGGGAAEALAPALVPTEDIIQALIDHLVAPLLPIRGSSQNPPSLAQQEAVAKQMHAVVLLYNYYHRRQFPRLDFLGFESFCKSASIAKPALLMYMKFMHDCDNSKGLGKQLSATEKMVMDACDISGALDASKDVPNMETWPIMKVAVFLINPTTGKCLLQFSSVTQGVWSLVEKELDAPDDNLVCSNQLKVHSSSGKKRTTGSSGESCEDVLQQLAFSEVEYKAGISRSNLCILERHLAYSLSKERTTTRLYVMQYTEAGKEELTEILVKDVVSSLRGPLVRRGLNTEVTSVVEHYLLLPYLGILSDWLHREACAGGSSDVLRQQADLNTKCTSESDKVHTLKDQRANSRFPKNEQIVDILSYRKSRTKFEEIDKNRKYVTCIDLCKADSTAGYSLKPSMEEQRTDDQLLQNGQTLEILINENREKLVTARSRTFGESCINESSLADCRSCSENNHLSLNGRQLIHEEDMVRDVILDSHANRRATADTYVAADVSMDGSDDKEGIGGFTTKPSPSKSPCKEPLSVPGIADAVQDGRATFDLPLVPLQLNSQFQDTFQEEMESKRNELHASLQVLQKRRNDLCKKQRNLEDEIAHCEMNIQRILTVFAEGDNLMPKVESVIEACNAFCSSTMQIDDSCCSGERRKTQNIKRKRLSEAVLCLRSLCQELDDICNENNWTLPRYNVLPSTADGMFQASVMVKGLDFECTTQGDLKRSSREARESAATCMLSKLHNMAIQEQEL